MRTPAGVTRRTTGARRGDDLCRPARTGGGSGPRQGEAGGAGGPEEAKSDNPFDNPSKPAGGSEPKASGPGAGVRKAALDGAPDGRRPHDPGHAAGRRRRRGRVTNYVGHGDMYYLCWSIERVAVAFGIDTIGDQDWYSWGCGYILPSQVQDGSFANGRHGTDVATAFAILFLSKSNYVADLTKRLNRSIKDPGRAERAAAGPTRRS